MTHAYKIIPHGSGPMTARGRAALRAELEPLLADVCATLGVGRMRACQPVDRGAHHLVWKASTVSGDYALRAGASASPTARRQHAKREVFWRSVGAWGVAPEYIGSTPALTRSFAGRIEVFRWINSRHFSAARDSDAVARVLARLHTQPVGAIKTALRRTPIVPFIRAHLREYENLNRGHGAVRSVLSSETASALSSLKGTSPRRGRWALVHNDLVDGNILRASNRICLIDWDWALLSSPCVDLFCFMSPFVRSWGLSPKQMSPRTANKFLGAYFRSCPSTWKHGELSSLADLWHPYNTLVANWLYHEAPRLPHTRKASFYRDSFQNVARMSRAFESFK